MNIIVTEPQISLFLRRRFLPEDLSWIVNDVKEMIDEGESVDTAVYVGSGLTVGKIRQYYTDKVSSYFGIPVHVRFELVSC